MIWADGGVKLHTTLHTGQRSHLSISLSTTDDDSGGATGGVCKQVYNMFPTEAQADQQPLLNYHTIYVGPSPVLSQLSQAQVWPLQELSAKKKPAEKKYLVSTWSAPHLLLVKSLHRGHLFFPSWYKVDLVSNSSSSITHSATKDGDFITFDQLNWCVDCGVWTLVRRP